MPRNKIFKRTLKPATEHQEQVSLFQWVKYMANSDKRFKNIVAVPNQGGKKMAKWGYFRKLEGLSPGFPDLCVLWPSFDGRYPAMFIELKSLHKGTKPTHHQEEWLLRLIEAGFAAHVAYGGDAAMQLITRHFGL